MKDRNMLFSIVIDFLYTFYASNSTPPRTPPHYAPPTECPKAPSKRRRLPRLGRGTNLNPKVSQQQIDEFFDSFKPKREEGSGDNFDLLQGQLDDLREHGKKSEASKMGVPNDADLPGGGNPAGSSVGVDLMNVGEAADHASVSGCPQDQFEIHPMMDLNLGNFYFSFTNLSLYMLITLGFVLLMIFLVTKKGGGKSVP